MCLRGWEKWDAGTLYGCTVRMHLVTGFCCDDEHKVSFRQVATDTAEWYYRNHWHYLLLLQLIYFPANHSHMGKLCGLLHDQLNSQCRPGPSAVHNHVSPVWSTFILDHHGCKSTTVSLQSFCSLIHHITVILQLRSDLIRPASRCKHPLQPSWLLQ